MNRFITLGHVLTGGSIALAIIAIAFAALIVPAIILGLARGRRHRIGFMAAENIGEGTREFDSLVPDVNIPVRYMIAKRGSDALHFALPTAVTDQPIGICEDQTNASAATPGLPFRINRLGTSTRSKKVAILTTVAQDDLLSSDGAGYAKKLPTTTGTYWVIGQAEQAGAASGDSAFPTVIEFIGVLPYKVIVP